MVFNTVDTVYDFVRYITKKEELVISGRLISAAGEEDLLAHDLQYIDDDDEHTFFPDWLDVNSKIAIDEGIWEDFNNSEDRKRQIEADKISYTWDELINKFIGHITNGTSYIMSHPDIKTQERLLHFLARESRTRRRLLSDAILGLLSKAKNGKQMGLRYVLPSRDGDPLYVFFVFPRLDEFSEDEYRKYRVELLHNYIQFAKVDFPQFYDFIGIATETGMSEVRSEDLYYLDASEWTSEQQSCAEALKKEYISKGMKAKKMNMFRGVINEYPDGRPTKFITGTKGRERNMPCPCGSGKKFKRCCGKKIVL